MGVTAQEVIEESNRYYRRCDSGDRPAVGFVDIKFCVVSEIWSGLKLVIWGSERM